MATYKEIHGVKVQYRDSDATAIEGDVWYNASTGLLKMYQSSGSWASGGNLNAVKHGSAAAGIQNAALCIGANLDAGPEDVVESYDGTSWTETVDINTARGYFGGCGTTTAAICSGGYGTGYTGETEEFDGSSWTEVADITARESNVCGTATAALSAGGFNPGSPLGDNQSIVESWNGTSWTEITDINTAGRGGGFSGTQTSALLQGGTPRSAVVESWNGSTWTEVGDLNTGRTQNVSGGESNAEAVTFGGAATLAVTEQYDGTSWTEVADLSAGRRKPASQIGTREASVCAGGKGSGGNTNATEEWTIAASAETIAFD